jgi:cyclopropane-fatty-acyl-phospholipid synthase
MAFREQALMVFQIQITKRQDVVPMTRDYIAIAEKKLRAAEAASRPPLRLAGE